MSLPAFLTMLFEHGRIRVPEFGLIAEREVAETRSLLAEFEVAYRTTLPNEVPEFLIESATGSAVVLYRACQCLVYRDLELPQALPGQRARGPGGRTAADHYSADVVLRFLPDVWRLSRDVASADPLVKYLLELAGLWPLSSVGIPDVQVAHLDEFLDDDCLLTLYADRILDRNDRTRLSDPRARSAVQSAIGPFTELAPEMSRHLEERQSATQ